nr:hypothetical protein [uncultured Clostridium sp.]
MEEKQTAEDKLKYQIEQLNKQVSELSVKNERQYNEIYSLKDESVRLKKENDRLFCILENISKAMAVGGGTK